MAAASLPAAVAGARAMSLSNSLASCTDLHAVHRLLLQALGPGPQLVDGAASVTAGSERGAAESGSSTSQPAVLHARDMAHVLKQLGTCWAASPQGPLEAAVLSDALRHVYAQLNTLLPTLAPRDVARCIGHLARLPTASANVLRQLAESLTSEKAQPTAGSAGLPQLSPVELAQCVGALARFNVRPSDAWLGSCMGELQLGLHRLPGRQLAQLLWGLVRLGVKPTSPWLALYESALQPSLAGPWQGAPAAVLASAAAAEGTPAGEAHVPGREPTLSSGSSSTSSDSDGDSGGSAAAAANDLQLAPEDVVHVVWALAEASYQPTPVCKAALLEASRVRLAACPTHLVSELAWAVAKLGWRPDAPWAALFVEVRMVRPNRRGCAGGRRREARGGGGACRNGAVGRGKGAAVVIGGMSCVEIGLRLGCPQACSAMTHCMYTCRPLPGPCGSSMCPPRPPHPPPHS